MSLLPTEPFQPTASRFRRLRGFFYVVVGLNVVAIVIALIDRSWLAVGIAILGAPIMNGLLALISLAVIRGMTRQAGLSLLGHIGLSIGGSAIAAVIDYFLILAMPLHGC